MFSNFAIVTTETKCVSFSNDKFKTLNKRILYVVAHDLSAGADDAANAASRILDIINQEPGKHYHKNQVLALIVIIISK